MGAERNSKQATVNWQFTCEKLDSISAFTRCPFRIRGPVITKEQALVIALEERAWRGWSWNPSMKVLTKPGWDYWRIYTLGKGFGMTFYIHKQTSELILVGRRSRQ